MIYLMLDECFFQANIYLLKVNNNITRNRCEVRSKLTMKVSERRQWHHSGVSIEHILQLFLAFLLLTLNM